MTTAGDGGHHKIETNMLRPTLGLLLHTIGSSPSFIPIYRVTISHRNDPTVRDGTGSENLFCQIGGGGCAPLPHRFCQTRQSVIKQLQNLSSIASDSCYSTVLGSKLFWSCSIKTVNQKEDKKPLLEKLASYKVANPS